MPLSNLSAGHDPSIFTKSIHKTETVALRQLYQSRPPLPILSAAANEHTLRKMTHHPLNEIE